MEQYLCLSLGECFQMLSNALGCKLRRISAVVAYVKESGVNILQAILGKEVLGRSTVVTGLDFYLTEPYALRRLMSLGAEVLVYAGDREFHPKLYLIECDDGREYLIVGSANISHGAITSNNIEANILTSDESIISKAKELIEEIKQQSINAKGIIEEYEKKRNEILTKLDKHKIPLLNLKPTLEVVITSREGRIGVIGKSARIDRATALPRAPQQVTNIEEAPNESNSILKETRSKEELTNKSENMVSKRHNNSLEAPLQSKHDIKVDTFNALHINVDRARTYIVRLLHQLVEQDLVELPRNIGERKRINLPARVYRPVANAYEVLKHGPVQREVVKCMHKTIGKQAGKRKRKAFWEALRLLLIAFRYGIKVTKEQGEKSLALAREYDGAFKSRREKNEFALRLVKCLERLGLVEVNGNYAMPNLGKLAELGLYEVAEGKLRLSITKIDDSTYRVTFVLLEPFKLQPRSYTLHKDDILNLLP